MKILKIILYTLLTIVALLMLAGAFAKKDYKIERSMTISAPSTLVMNTFADFNNMPTWSPWSALDPNMTTQTTGTPLQVGSKYTWKGNDKVGEGSQTITAITPERVDIDLEFLKPWKSIAKTHFIAKNQGESTHAAWTINTTIPFPYNGLAMFTDVDKGMGKDFEQGLKNIKKRCESQWDSIQKAQIEAAALANDTLALPPQK